jgi:hypothetical protein
LRYRVKTDKCSRERTAGHLLQNHSVDGPRLDVDCGKQYDNDAMHLCNLRMYDGSAAQGVRIFSSKPTARDLIYLERVERVCSKCRRRIRARMCGLLPRRR